MYEIKRAKSILQKDGFLGLIKKFSKYTGRYFNSKDYIPKIMNFRHTTINELLNFSYNNFDGLIKPMQVRSEITNILEGLEKKKPRSVLEIGTANGGTLFLLSRVSHENAKIISVDLPGGEFGGGYPEWKVPLYNSFAVANQKMELVRADSHKEETLQKVRELLKGEELDLLFIDGDHTYEGVKKDYQMYNSLVKKGGIIVFHDVAKHKEESDCHVDIFWNEVRKGKKHAEFIESKDQGWAGIGVIRKD